MKQRKGYLFCCNCGYLFPSDQVFLKDYKINAFVLCRDCALELLKDCAQFASKTAKGEREQDFFSMVDSRIKYDQEEEKYSFAEY